MLPPDIFGFGYSSSHVLRPGWFCVQCLLIVQCSINRCSLLLCCTQTYDARINSRVPVRAQYVVKFGRVVKPALLLLYEYVGRVIGGWDRQQCNGCSHVHIALFRLIRSRK